MRYKHGAKCPTSATGDDYTFSINVYCDPSVEEIDYIPIAQGDACQPYVNIISQYGCSALDVSEIWQYFG